MIAELVIPDGVVPLLHSGSLRTGYRYRGSLPGQDED